MKKLAFLMEQTDNCIIIKIDPNKHPKAYKRAIDTFVESGWTEEDAKADLLYGFEMEVFYSDTGGVFLVESSAIENTPIYDPYTGEEIVCESSDDNFLNDLTLDEALQSDFESLSEKEFIEKYKSLVAGFNEPPSKVYENTMTLYQYQKDKKE